MKIRINAKNRTYSFEGQEKESVLFSGLTNGIRLPYACGTGTCGTCKAKLVEGKIQEHWPEAPGLKYLKPDQGEFLMCQCSPSTDISVELANFVHPAEPGTCLPKSFVGVIRRAEHLTHDVMFLEVEPEKPQDFDAGQFVSIGVPGIQGKRAYSMVNFEPGAKKLEFVIKKKPGGGCTEWLFAPGNQVEGTALEVIGPLGNATFHPNTSKNNILCIAGGTGIAGMMSILARGVRERHFEQYKGYVFFGVRTLKDTFFLHELTRIKQAFPQSINIVVALSDEEVPSSAKSDYPELEFEHGLVHQVAARHMKDNYQNVKAYLAGPPPLVDAAIRTLIVEARLAPDNIVYDKFS